MMHRTTWTAASGLTAAVTAGLLVITAPAPAQDTPGQETPSAVKSEPGTQDGKPAAGDPQDPAKPTPAPTPKPATEPAQGGSGSDAKKGDDTDLRDLNPFSPPASGETDLEDLFRVVEKRLKRVTSLLYDASSGDASNADGIGGAGIDELIRGAESEAAGASSGIARMLQATRGQSQATLEDIKRILEIAEQQQGGGGGGGGSQPPPTPSEGMPQQGQTPSGSRKEDKGEAPPEGGKPEGQKPDKPGGEDPKDGDEPKGDKESEGSPDGSAKPPAEGATGDPASAGGLEDWGDLPVHLRQVFQNGVSEDVPPRYRDWVDSYYKRLNRRSKKR